MRSPSDDELVAEQREFYDADAADFDAWLGTLVDETNDEPAAITHRRGRHNAAALFTSHAPLGDTLELAGGTGRLVELYRPHATSVTMVDASPASIALARSRLGDSPDVDLLVADVFEWDAGGRRFDTIVFAAWLHHVPESRFAPFWSRVNTLLSPGGLVVFDFPDADRPVPGHHDISETPGEDYRFHAPVDDISIRDHHGRRWRVVHRRWSVQALGADLNELGWEMTAVGPGLSSDIVWATASRR